MQTRRHVLAITGLALCFFLGAPLGRQSLSALAQQAGSHLNRIPVAAETMLEHADSFEVLALDPFPRHPKKKTDFYGRQILAKVSITDPIVREQLVSALKSAALHNQGDMAMCFNPRHGIRVTRKGKQTDFVICFECLQAKVYGEGKGDFLVTNSPQPLFDKVLHDAAVAPK